MPLSVRPTRGMPANLWLRYFPEVPGADLDASELKKQTELRRDLAELGQLVAGTLKPSDVLASSHALHVRWHTLPERVRRWLDGDHGPLGSTAGLRPRLGGP